VAAAGSREPLSSTSGTRSKVVVATVVAVAIGVLALLAGLLLPMLPALGDDRSAQERDVLQRVEDFAVTYNTYDVADKDDYQERMRPLLTEGYFGEFQQITDAVFSALDSDEQSSGDARVLVSAVESMDDDSAVALVGVDASISTSAEEAAVERRFRWRVTLAKQGDDWLVSQFEQVVPVDAEVGEPGEQGGLVPETEDEGTPQDGAPPEGTEQDGTAGEGE
jgi:hypothetical protein